MNDIEAGEFISEQITRIKHNATILEQEWQKSRSVQIAALSAIESAIGRLNRRLFGGR